MKKVLSLIALLGLVSQVNAGILDEINYRYGDSTNKPGIAVARARGQFGFPEHLYANDVLNGIYGYGYDAAFNSAYDVSIELQASENWTSSANGSQILFKATAIGSTSPTTMFTISGSSVTATLETPVHIVLPTYSITVTTPAYVGEVIQTSAGIVYIGTGTATINQWSKLGAQ